MVHFPHPLHDAFVTTIKEKCRVCYTCVRECPAKAIRIMDGQAQVIGERCIGCGNCVRVCSQHAKEVTSSIPEVEQLLQSGDKIAACVAPSFPAEFPDMEAPLMVAMIRALGFDLVNEVAFGADLVASKYRDLINHTENQSYIATTCPAIVGYIERYHPKLVESLAPIVSPMVAIARVIRHMYGDEVKIVFIGPCIAKKSEACSHNLPDEVNAALTFSELRQMFTIQNLSSAELEPVDFDPPHAGLGALFPVSRGLLQAANIREDLTTSDVITADGRSDFVEAIKEFETGALEPKLLEVLCCNGCIMGAGMTTSAPLFRRRAQVSQYVRHHMHEIDLDEVRRSNAEFADMDLNRRFSANDQRISVPSEQEMNEILLRMGKHSPGDELNCGACGYDTCREHAIAIYKGLAESEMCLPYTIERLRSTVSDLAISHEQLASAQEALMQSEKLASMGQLAAGIAHEINNPLGVILMYSHILLEECKKESEQYEDLQMVSEQADRCKVIVTGLLDFARGNKLMLSATNISELVKRSLDAVPKPENISILAEHKCKDHVVQLDRDQITQVLINLIGNAYAAMPDGGVLKVCTKFNNNNTRIIVTDSGIGIPQENVAKIFDPFFTTRPMGRGTGLGLAVAYGIIRMHHGDIKVKSKDNASAGPTGTTFTITLPHINDVQPESIQDTD
jgi:signal transduction histidine kinase/iron only hydrogenase large subunit-like protein